jgi:hypothetical protein
VLEEVGIEAIEKLEQKRASEQGRNLSDQGAGVCGC